MPTWRKLHLKTTESLDLADMPDDFTRLLWVLLPLKLCREGRGIDRPVWIRAQIFPLRSDISEDQVEDAMRWYHERGMITRYQVRGRPYFQVRSWHKYQGNTSREAESAYPAPEESDEEGDEVEVEPIREASQYKNRVYAADNFPDPKKTNLPAHLWAEDLAEAWDSWRAYHQERGRPLTVGTALRQFKKFEEHSTEENIAAIEYSILNNYTGLIYEKVPNIDDRKPAGYDVIQEMMADVE